MAIGTKEEVGGDFQIEYEYREGKGESKANVLVWVRQYKGLYVPGMRTYGGTMLGVVGGLWGN